MYEPNATSQVSNFKQSQPVTSSDPNQHSVLNKQKPNLNPQSMKESESGAGTGLLGAIWEGAKTVFVEAIAASQSSNPERKEEAKENIKQKGEEVKDKANDLKEQAKDKASDLADQAQQKGQDIKDNAQQSSDEVEDTI